MPELPEVQSVISYLQEEIIGAKIVDVKIVNNKFLKNVSEEDFEKTLLNSSFKSIERIGKYIIFNLSNNYSIVSHLRMEGKYFVRKVEKRFKHDYLFFFLDNSKLLVYNDTRQFGTIHLCPTSDLHELKEIKKIAIDPLNPKFDVQYLKEKIHKLKKSIKNVLLDQTIVSGIGNIYANEILFAAKINPFTPCNQISDADLLSIIKESKRILKLAIENKGTTIKSYAFNGKDNGSFQDFLKVQSREKLNCFDCEEIIVRKKDGGRSSFFCPKCQK